MDPDLTLLILVASGTVFCLAIFRFRSYTLRSMDPQSLEWSESNQHGGYRAHTPFGKGPSLLHFDLDIPDLEDDGAECVDEARRQGIPRESIRQSPPEVLWDGRFDAHIPDEGH